MQEVYNTHGERVSAYAVQLAAGLSMSSDEIAMLEVGAKLNDIGKLLVRRELLNAGRPLSPAEKTDLENHAHLGHLIVSRAGYADIIQKIVLHHHEKWDGTGYPRGIKGNQIPLPVQIVSICDVYEAMTHMRPYREAYSHEFTISYLKSRATFDFSPQLVDLFVAQVRHG
jgi:HD-GYP domain-containing protein (c-di-GMP phosphodiesterase class II)